MRKSKTGAVAIEELVGILIVTIFVVILLLYFHITNIFNQSQKQKQTEISFEDLNTNYNLNYFLHLPVDDNKIVADLVSEEYISNEYSQLKTLADEFFSKIYDTRRLSYDITIGEKKINYVKFDEVPSSSVIEIPITTKQSLKVKLDVGKQGAFTPNLP